MRISRLLGLALCVMLATACGDDDDTAPGDGANGDAPDGGADAATDAPPAATLELLCNSDDGLFNQILHKVYACFPEYESFLGPEDMDRITSLCDGSLRPFLEDGTAVFTDDPTAVADCIDYVNTATCQNLVFFSPGPCDRLIDGTIGPNGDCDDSIQCEGENFCDHSNDALTCGLCKARKSSGTACGEDDECVSHHCSEAGTCRVLADVGDACTTKSDCLGSLVCDPDMNTCQPEPSWALNSHCLDILDCDAYTSDHYCDTTVQRCTSFAQVGEPCGPSDNNRLCRIFQYESCQEDPPLSGAYACQPATVVADGVECGWFEGAKCMDGSACRNDDGDLGTPDRCTSLAPVGGSCSSDDLCDYMTSCVEGHCQFGAYTAMCPAP